MPPRLKLGTSLEVLDNYMQETGSTFLVEFLWCSHNQKENADIVLLSCILAFSQEKKNAFPNLFSSEHKIILQMH
jgi:hypothetical protein